MKHGRTDRGETGFERFYSEMHGDRWPGLREALLSPPEYATFEEGLLKPYFLDRASVVTARALGAEPGDSVLDMCAAPGGKTLVIAAMLAGQGSLTANDRSAARRDRLIRVIRDHLPPDSAGIVRVTGHDAVRWCLHEENAYRRILLDVPCSSERHVLSSPRHLAEWSPSRSKRLAAQAYAMAAGAVRVLEPGGLMVYSTCTVSEGENDGVIARLLERSGVEIGIEQVRAETGEASEFGWRIWPDSCGGMGPMYIAKVRRIR